MAITLKIRFHSENKNGRMSLKEKLKPKVYMKRVLVVYNLLFLISGVCVISLGLYFAMNRLYYVDTKIDQVVHTTYEQMYDTSSFPVVNTLYTIGIIMSAVAFLGCVGAYRESVYILTLFSLCLLTVFVLEITCVTAGYIMREEIKKGLWNTMNALLNDCRHNPASRNSINSIQEMLDCCGVNSCEDWPQHNISVPIIDQPYPQEDLADITLCGINLGKDDLYVLLPDTCCEEYSSNDLIEQEARVVGKEYKDPWFSFRRCKQISKYGCIHQLEFLIQRYFILTAGLASGIAALQLTGIVFACLLAKVLYVQRIKLEIQHSELKEELISNDSQGDPPLYMQVKCEPSVEE